MPSDTEQSGGNQWRGMLAARPVRNHAARVEQHADGRITIYVKRKRPAYMVPPLSWLIPVRAERRISLDILGTQVWNGCDGTRAVENIVDAFAAKHRLTFHEARVAVTEYLRALLQRGVIAMIMQQESV